MNIADHGSPQQKKGQLDTLLHCSVKRYEDILALFSAINNEGGGNNAATLDRRGTEVLQLQEQAALADQDLVAAIMQDMPLPGPAHLLLDKRRDIIQQILRHNRLLLTTISNIKSLLAHEIKEAQGGRAALNGYRQINPSQNGGLLKGSL